MEQVFKTFDTIAQYTFIIRAYVPFIEFILNLLGVLRRITGKDGGQNGTMKTFV